MTRHRTPPLAPMTSVAGTIVPPELIIGALADVWATEPGGVDLIEGKRRYNAARRAWQAAAGLDGPASFGLLPAKSPYRLTDSGGPSRLARYGFTPDQVPWLRDRAATYQWKDRS